MDYPAMGYSIRYEYGLFKQKIVDGWQTEMPDVWLPNGEVWLVPRTDNKVEVKFDGQIEEKWEYGNLHINHYNYISVEAVPYDMMISGKDSEAVSVPVSYTHLRQGGPATGDSGQRKRHQRGYQPNAAALVTKAAWRRKGRRKNNTIDVYKRQTKSCSR